VIRLVAVLGYSDRECAELHPVCAARLERAEREIRPDDVLLFSGWARHGRAQTEADLMSRSWTASGHSRIVDRGARTTLGNAMGIGRAARRLGVGEVVLVTSGWHARRASVLVRAALLGSRAELHIAATDETATMWTELRELLSWAGMPLFALVAARTR
jgi:DUF218 domain